MVVSRLEAYMRERELRMERLNKRLDLPPFLKQVATSLNLLAVPCGRWPVD
jgi:hypothetical protein